MHCSKTAHKTAHKTARKSAFTLIEILIVVAIIGIIAAILFPVFARARENGRRSSCQSNIKQIAMGLRMYIGDSDGRFPQASFAPNSSLHGWSDAIFTYTKSLKILQCPSESTPAQSDPMQIGYTDFSYNSNLGKLNESQLTATSATIMVCEGIAFSSEQPNNGDDSMFQANPTADCAGNSAQANAQPGIYQQIQPGGIFNPDVSRHFAGGNYAFADGHVQWLKPESVFNNCTAPANNATFAYK